MKRIALIFCLVLTVIGSASAQNVDRLIRQAQSGKVEAYKSLAIAYRDGGNLEKSWLNMLCMYEIYCLKTNGQVCDIVASLDANDPFRMLTDILNMQDYNDAAKALHFKLREVSSIEAEAIDAAALILGEDDSLDALDVMWNLALRGSELAAIYVAAYYEEADHKSRQEEYYTQMAMSYPVFYLLLGDVYIERYHDSGDFTDVQKALDCYYMADDYGMLTPRYANGLLALYDYFGGKGLVEVRKMEISRLKKIAVTYRTHQSEMSSDVR